MDIEWIKQRVRSGNYEFSGHADDERQAKRISIADVEGALLDGEILEDYPNDPRGPSCLVLGHGSPGHPAGKPLPGDLGLLQYTFLPCPSGLMKGHGGDNDG